MVLQKYKINAILRGTSIYTFKLLLDRFHNL